MKVQNPVITTILERRSVRDFLDKTVPEDALSAIIKCGIYAPTARNRQSWHFTVITNREVIETMNAYALEGMNKLGIQKEPGYHLFFHAPVVIVLSSALEGYSEINCGCALQNIALAAKSLGLDTCIIGQTRYMYQQDNIMELNRLLKIPEGYQHDCSIAIGYRKGENPEAKPRREDIVDYLR